ncbi:MAG: prepilin-type N-terminal cleavage/methylation domain-containing protein [Chloroflexi bacterium]|jgi:prepilin-type N-terminal cleavage/methylation domain-containing protein|nr:prepilin-type N-terminal cleavage/methylation domain-containing protein [Chloroflexota bacterium]
MRKDDGFTLVELLIVLGIVAVMVGVVAMSFQADAPALAEAPAALGEMPAGEPAAEWQVVQTAIEAYNTFDVAEGAAAIPPRAAAAAITPGDADAPFAHYLKRPTVYAYAWGAEGAALAQP